MITEITKRGTRTSFKFPLSNFQFQPVRRIQDRSGGKPFTREDMVLGARRVVTFKCSRPLKQKLNGKGKKS